MLCCDFIVFFSLLLSSFKTETFAFYNKIITKFIRLLFIQIRLDCPKVDITNITLEHTQNICYLEKIAVKIKFCKTY